MAALPRRTGIVSVTILTAMTLAVVIAQAIAPDWSRAMTQEMLNQNVEEVNARDSDHSRQNLDIIQRELIDQIEASNGVIRKLEQRQTTLIEAVEELKEINAGRQCFAEALKTAYPELESYSVRIAKYAMSKLQRRLEKNADESSDLMDCLEAEYQSLLLYGAL